MVSINDAKLAADRYDICKACEFYLSLPKLCKKCGCVIPFKVQIKKASCPLNKW